MIGDAEHFRAARWPLLAAVLAFSFGIAVGRSFQRSPVQREVNRPAAPAVSASATRSSANSKVNTAQAGVETDGEILTEMEGVEKGPTVSTDELKRRIQAGIEGGKLKEQLLGTIATSVTKENAAEL